MARSASVLLPHPFLTAALFFLLISSSSCEESDATSALQQPTPSLSLSLGVSEELKGGSNRFDFLSLLPSPRPQQRGRPEREELKQAAALQGSAAGKGSCTYTVSIKTSCSSPRVTRDAISLTFGDVNHNEVYAARLDDPASRTFERCSVDTFRMSGPCGSRTCYLYLYRSGRDGWTPEYVKVFYRPGDTRTSVTFYYGSPIPNAVWYGFNLCNGAALPTAGTTDIHAMIRAMQQ
uniref:ATP synthase subunit delta n=1 Tax=Anthurium amnicola TaxID=1678845 RepID=A0A1D1Y9E1_9ARAE